MTPETRYQREPGVLLREIDGELLLLNTDTDSYFGLNQVGAAMYQSLVDGATVGDTVASVCEAFDADEGTVANDLSGLVDNLVAKGLLAETSG